MNEIYDKLSLRQAQTSEEENEVSLIGEQE